MPRIAMRLIAVSKVRTMKGPASGMGSRRSAFRNVAARKLLSVPPTRKPPAFRRAQRFHAGIEGHISVLFHGRGMKCCRAKGRERFEVFVGAAVPTNNLLRIATLLQSHTKKPTTSFHKAKAPDQPAPSTRLHPPICRCVFYSRSPTQHPAVIGLA